jgi:predicted AAA+ superfamily ATPase
MQTLDEKQYGKLQQTDISFVRSLIKEINWKARLIGIKRTRGVGKTTLMLQRIKPEGYSVAEALYVSAYNIWSLSKV